MDEEMFTSIQMAPLLSIEEAQRQGRLLKALADPTRLRILSLLADGGGTFTVKQIVACFDLEQATISGHLHLLYHTGLIDFRKRQRHVFYFLNEQVFRQAIVTLEGILPAKRQGQED